MFHEKVSVGTQSCTLRMLTLLADRVTRRESVCPGLSWTHCSDHMSLSQQPNSTPCAQESKQMCAYVGHIHTLQRLMDHSSYLKLRPLQFWWQECCTIAGMCTGWKQNNAAMKTSTAGDCNLVRDSIASPRELPKMPEQRSPSIPKFWTRAWTKFENVLKQFQCHKLTPWSPANTVFSILIKSLVFSNI